jgi:hypothetical protein
VSEEVEQLAREHGWVPESGNTPLLHLDVLLYSLTAELGAVDRALGLTEDSTRYSGARAFRIRTALDELDRHRRAARAVQDMR